MEINKDQFKKTFPHLARDMSDNQNGVTIDSIRSDTRTAEKTATARKNLSNYNPDVIDFLRRCDNTQQAEDIINYMQRRSEITNDYAKKLHLQLKKKGLRSFGPKKEEGYYFKVSSK